MTIRIHHLWYCPLEWINEWMQVLAPTHNYCCDPRTSCALFYRLLLLLSLPPPGLGHSMQLQVRGAVGRCIVHHLRSRSQPRQRQQMIGKDANLQRRRRRGASECESSAHLEGEKRKTSPLQNLTRPLSSFLAIQFIYRNRKNWISWSG